MKRFIFLFVVLFSFSCSSPSDFDLIIRGGTIYDGSGNPSFVADLAVSADTIAAIGDLRDFRGTREIDASGLAVSPGFINMLSWANESLIADGRSQSDIRQGVTLEVMGEGWSQGPLNEAMKQRIRENQGDIRYPVTWTTLNEYLEFLESRGVSCNIASFVGAGTVRIHEIGYENRPPTAEELKRMKELVRQAMEEGALGLSSALIYTPDGFASTEELVELAKVVADYDGLYISHIRSEGDRLLEAIDELLTIARNAKVRAEIFHLKAAGEKNWSKLAAAIQKIEQARSQGLDITADMYCYTAGATGLDAAMPPWCQEGGLDAWIQRLSTPEIREKIRKAMVTPSSEWENLYLAAGSPERVLLVGFKTDSLKYLTGKSLAEIARLRGTTPEETMMDLVVQDHSRVEAVYFLMSEENVRRQIQLPWVSFCSDAASLAPEGVFLKSNPHPRAYGNFARLLGKYVREEKLIPLEEAVRRLTSFPALNLRLKKRGLLKIGYYADVVIFDQQQIQDHATYEQPHQFATGVEYVLVNGVPVLWKGEHTGKFPGRVVRGPGWQP